MPAPPPPPQVLVGVLTSPTGHGAGRRARISEWNSHFGAAGVDVRFVVGSAYYNGTRHRTPLGDALLQPPRLPPSDFLVVDGREHLPHVGVATEKSAAWWGSVAAPVVWHGRHLSTSRPRRRSWRSCVWRRMQKTCSGA